MPKRRIITAIIHLHLSAAGENGHYSQSVQAQKEIFVYLGILLSYMLLFKVIRSLTYLFFEYIKARGISILGEVRNVAISSPTQQLLWYKFHDFLAVFALEHSKINQIA